MNNLLVLNSMNRFIGDVSSEDLSRLLQTSKHCWQTLNALHSIMH